MDYPLCFGTEQNFEAWVSFAELFDDGEEPRLSFCNYCTKDYQTAMKKLSKCQNPDFQIKEDDEEWD